MRSRILARASSVPLQNADNFQGGKSYREEAREHLDWVKKQQPSLDPGNAVLDEGCRSPRTTCPHIARCHGYEMSGTGPSVEAAVIVRGGRGRLED